MVYQQTDPRSTQLSSILKHFFDRRSSEKYHNCIPNLMLPWHRHHLLPAFLLRSHPCRFFQSHSHRRSSLVGPGKNSNERTTFSRFPTQTCMMFHCSSQPAQDIGVPYLILFGIDRLCMALVTYYIFLSHAHLTK